MYCNKCGSALPSHGYICKNCGAMMSEEQIATQKSFNKENNNKVEVNLLTDRYNVNKTTSSFKPRKENKLVGVLFIILIVLVLIILAIIKVM